MILKHRDRHEAKKVFSTVSLYEEMDKAIEKYGKERGRLKGDIGSKEYQDEYNDSVGAPFEVYNEFFCQPF